MRLTAKERILLHLLEFVAQRDAVEVPEGMGQEAVARAASVDIRHLTQYIRPLVQEGLVAERTAHVLGARQRRKVYGLTDAGRMASIRLRERTRSEVVRVRDATGLRDATVSDVVQETGGRASLLDVVRASMETGAVDLSTFTAPSAAGLVERLADAPRLEKFVGRRHELEAVTKDGEGPRVFVVRGVAGIGKSSFAARACELLRGSRNLFWHRVRPWDTRRSILASLGDFLSAIGRPGLRTVLSHADAGRADEALRDGLPGTRSLLVFDDAHEAASEVVSFLRFLKDLIAEAADVRVLVLTRQTVPFYDRRDVAIRGLVLEMDLVGLDAEEIAAFLGKDAADPRSADIGRRLGGHPLFLELVRSSARPAGGPLLRDVRRFIEEEIYVGLSDAQRRVMKTASLYSVPVPREALLADPTVSHDVLLSLVDKSLVRSVGEDGFEVHETIREFFASILTPAEREGLSHFALEQLRRLAARADHAGDTVSSIHCLSNALQLAMSDRDRFILWEGLGDAAERIGDLPRTLAAYREALRATADPEGVARLHRKAASALQVRGEMAPSLAEIDAGIAALGEVPSAERGWLDLARCRVATKQEAWQEARERGGAALDIFRHHVDLAGQAQALLELGNIEINSQTSDPKTAERYLTQALDLTGSIEDPGFTARVHIALAHLFANRFGDADRAMRSIGSIEALLPYVADPHIKRSFLMLQGWFHLELLADYAAAERFFSDAMALARRIYDPATVAFAKYGLAYVRYFQGRVEEARHAYETFSAEIDALGFPGYAVEAMWMVAECSLRMGDLTGFRRVAAALEDPKFARGSEARPIHIRVLRGIDLLSRGDRRGSRAAFEDALHFAGRGVAVDEASLEHFVHSFYGLALLAMGEEQKGGEHLRRSMEFLERYGQKARLSVLREMRERVPPLLRSRAPV